jgi:fatty-acyl-CoA synthase
MVLDETGSQIGIMEDGKPAPTPTDDSLPRRLADFATLGEALDYAARAFAG